MNKMAAKRREVNSAANLITNISCRVLYKTNNCVGIVHTFGNKHKKVLLVQKSEYNNVDSLD